MQRISLQPDRTRSVSYWILFSQIHCSVMVVASSVYVRLVPVRSKVRSGTFCRLTPVRGLQFVHHDIPVRRGRMGRQVPPPRTPRSFPSRTGAGWRCPRPGGTGRTCSPEGNKLYSAFCMRRNPTQIVKINVPSSSWRKTKNTSRSMRFFHEQAFSLTA